jgi:hypothetical protein
MTQLRFVLIVLNGAAIAVLLAIPIGKLLGVLHEEVDTAAIFGWFIFFIPAAASLLALWGIQFSRPSLTRPSIAVALLGSFWEPFKERLRESDADMRDSDRDT